MFKTGFIKEPDKKPCCASGNFIVWFAGLLEHSVQRAGSSWAAQMAWQSSVHRMLRVQFPAKGGKLPAQKKVLSKTLWFYLPTSIMGFEIVGN